MRFEANSEVHDQHLKNKTSPPSAIVIQHLQTITSNLLHTCLEAVRVPSHIREKEGAVACGVCRRALGQTSGIQPRVRRTLNSWVVDEDAPIISCQMFP